MSLKDTIGFEEMQGMVRDASNLSNISGFKDLAKSKAKKALDVKLSSLGKNVGETLSGIQSLTSEYDGGDIETKVSTGIAKITGSVPGFEDLLKEKVTKKNTISAITGIASSAIDEVSELSEIISSASPKSIASNLQSITGKVPSVKTLMSLGVDANAFESIKGLVEDVNEVKDKVNKIENEFQNVLDNFSSNTENILGPFKGGTLDRVIANTNNVILNEVNSISKGILKPLDQFNAVQSVINGDKSAVANLVMGKILEKTPNIPNIADIEAQIFKLDPSIANMIRPEISSIDFGNRTTPVVNNSSQESKWKGADTDIWNYTFTFVNSYEELVSDIRSSIRPITEIVVHWTGNYVDQGNIGAKEIHNWHTQDGFTGCGYHYIIKRNGDLQRGRPLNKVGAHAEVNGHDENSIGIALVGGFNCASGTRNPNKYLSAESIRQEQWKTLKEFIRAFYSVHPGGQVWGHRDTDPDQIDPGIDMRDYIEKNFKRKNTKSSGTKPPLLSKGSTSTSPAETAIEKNNKPLSGGEYVLSKFSAKHFGFPTYAKLPEFDMISVMDDAKAGKYNPGTKFVVHSPLDYNFSETEVYQIWEAVIDRGFDERQFSLVNISDPDSVARFNNLAKRSSFAGYRWIKG
tara:strand:+ start:8001 stop:9896 length:1896 start_codon:yes stop_codon:yes gene_type:complete